MPTIVDSSESPVPVSALQSDNGGLSRHEPTPSVTPGQRQTSASDEEGGNDNTAQQQPSSFSSTQQNDENDDEEWLVACRCENGKTLVTLLSCLQDVAANPSDLNTTSTSLGTSTGMSTTQSSRSFSQKRKKRKKIQPVTIFCTPSGFTFHVCGPAKQSEASIELQKDMFSQYQVRQDGPDQADWQAGGEFCVNLTTVMDALQWLGPLDGRTSVGLSYNLQSEIFKIELLHDSGMGSAGGVLCTTAIPGLMAPEDDPEGNSLSNAFRSSPVAARMMVRSGILRDLLPELTVAGASTARVAVSAKRGLEIAVLGHFGEAWIQIPSVGDHMVSPLELADEKKTVTRSYAMHSLISSMKGLEISEESVLSINSQGIMAIQHKTIDPTCQGSSNFVDFIMTCLEDEEDEDDDNDDQGEEETTISQQSATQATLRSFQNSQEQSQMSFSQATATAARRERRKRTSRATDDDDDDEEESRRSTPKNMTGEDDIMQGSSDTEGEDQSPRERQKLQAQRRRKQSEPTPSSSDDDSDDDENNNATSSLAAPLSLVRPTASQRTGSGTETPPRRRQSRSASRSRSRPSSANKRRTKAQKSSGGNESDASKNMLESDDDDDDLSSDDEGHLDLEALARSPTREQPREEECASPELVYG